MVQKEKNASGLHASLVRLLKEDDVRVEAFGGRFNAITGEGSIGARRRVAIGGFPIAVQWLPVEMLDVPLVKELLRAGSLDAFVKAMCSRMGVETIAEDVRQSVIDHFIRLRMRYDFAFWAYLLVWIHPKGGGDDVRFKLNHPQRKLVGIYEELRKAGKPIRIILLKARQWGGSTVTQMYFAWLQLVHKTGLNSLIVSHVLSSSYTILDMFNNMLSKYPASYLHRRGEPYVENEKKWVMVGQSGSIHEIPQRSCKVKVGTAERPDSDRSGDYSLVHLSEVGLWKKTLGKTPEDLVQGATSGILLKPYTMIVIESTAKGTGNYFHREYEAAKKGVSQFKNVFVAWYEIEQYRLAFADERERAHFAEWLFENRENRNVMSEREEPGIYLWHLWELGASLEAIHWYVSERRKYNDHGRMASEYPSDDTEAFVHSGDRVFDVYQVEKFRSGCRAPAMIGDVYGRGDEGSDALRDLRFKEDRQGLLWVWEEPDLDDEYIITDRYEVVVDIGGRSSKADWSVIVVFDRLYMKDGDKPVVVAQWYGHCDIDLLAWKSAQIAAWYGDALLVIESNTLETHDKQRFVDGDQSQYVLNAIKDVYPNLYERKKPADSTDDGEVHSYGFHTNVATKPMVISTLVKVIREHLYCERDERCLDEYLTYERKENGAFGAIDGRHDDLLMTRAIGLHVCFYEMDLPREISRDSFRLPRRSAVSEASL